MLKNLFPCLKVRILDAELMEQSINVRKIINTVKQFRYTNFFFSRSRYLLKHFIVNDMLLQSRTTYTFLDVGAGGCDLARWLARLCKKKQLNIRITCLEQDQRIVDYAKNACRRYPEIQVLHGSVMELTDLDSFDYIFSNHFLHNFSAADLVVLFDKFYEHAKNLFLMNDLIRSCLSYWGFYLFSTIFLRRSFAVADGLMSIRKGFFICEMQQIIRATRHQEQIQLRRYMPGRLVAIGIKSQNRKDTRK